MAFQSVPDTAQASVVGTFAGQTVVNTFNATKSGGYTEADLQALADAVATAWSGAVLPLLGSQYAFDRVEVRGLESAIDLQAVSTIGAGLGAVTSGTCPVNTAVAVKRRSNQTGRGARGRVYIPGIPTAALTDSATITSAFASDLVDALTDVHDAIGVAEWVEVIIHRVAAGAPLATAVLFSVVEYVAVDLALDSMRRRLKGRGV